MDRRISSHYLAELQAKAESAGKQCLVGAIILNEQRRAFVQKRSLTRQLWPGCWDLVGGHVEPGETLEEALRREIREETGWKLARIGPIVDVYDGKTVNGDEIYEVDFLVEIDGDLEHPQLEWSKNSEFRWISLAEIETLKENRQEADIFIYEIVKKGLELAASVPSSILQGHGSVAPQHKPEDWRAIREEFEKGVAEEVISEDPKNG
jgi:8-oxo-dGTP diphosphatase